LADWYYAASPFVRAQKARDGVARVHRNPSQRQ
jgi:hypothetical protein